MWRSLCAGVMLTACLTGCSGENDLRCESTDRYATATSAPPVQIPDDLSPPDETNSLRLPPASTPENAPGTRERCLETPPDYFEQRPGQRSDAAAPQEGRAPSTAPQPEREISN
jgi:hypothetical protein